MAQYTGGDSRKDPVVESPYKNAAVRVQKTPYYATLNVVVNGRNKTETITTRGGR